MTISINAVALIFFLLVAFQAKHLICDYFLQNEYMLGKFHPTEWHYPLAAHAAVHAIATTLLLAPFVGWYALVLGMFDGVLHFWIDRLKVVSSRPYDSKTDAPFWWLLGVDQMLHHLVHYYLILVVIVRLFIS